VDWCQNPVGWFAGPGRGCDVESHKELVDMFVFVRAVAVRAGVAVGGAAGVGLGALARHVAAADMNRGDS
jgi:hypothetical protein